MKYDWIFCFAIGLMTRYAYSYTHSMYTVQLGFIAFILLCVILIRVKLREMQLKDLRKVFARMSDNSEWAQQHIPMTDKTIPHKTWKFDEGHYIPSTNDGDNMTGGPTEGYWKVHATHRVSGYVTMGRGETYLEALQECVKHANEKDAAASSVAGTFCEIMGYPLTDIDLYKDEAAKHIAWHKAMKKHGEFYQ